MGVGNVWKFLFEIPRSKGGYNISLFNISVLPCTDVSLVLMQPILQLFMNESAYEKYFSQATGLEALGVLINF